VSLNGQWADGILTGLRDGGVRRFVVCPGSRSAPLALAAWPLLDDADRDAVVDERSAGFYALGCALDGTPAAVITTSGTAVANLLPAVVEAHQADVPLVLVTADRPPELRDTGANQTIFQPGLFGRFTRWAADLPCPAPDVLGQARRWGARAALAAMGWPPGPVHLNVPLREPLAPDPEDAGRPRPAASPQPGADPPAAPTSPPGPPPRGWDRALRGGRGVVVVGPLRAGRDRVRQAVRKVGLPVLADALSGLRWTGPADPAGPAMPVTAHDAFLADGDVRATLRPDWILQVGGLPTSKHLQRWICDHADVPRVRIDGTGRRWDGIGTPCTLVVGDAATTLAGIASRDAPAGDAQDAWGALWRRLDEAAWTATADALSTRAGRASEAAAVGAVLDAAPPRVLVGNSLPVRDVERFGRPGRGPGSLVANRGASGIDGLVATTAGLGGVGLIGDMAFRHDIGSLPLLRRRRARLVVVDNGGGRIFDRLPVVGAPLPEGAYERLFLAPSTTDLPAACRAAGLRAEACAPDGLRDAISDRPGDGADVVIVTVDGAASTTWRERHLAAVAEAVRPLAAVAAPGSRSFGSR